MVTTWPPKLPVLQTGCERLAKLVGELTGGRLTIDVYAAGELVPPMGIFDAVSNGTVQVGSGASATTGPAKPPRPNGLPRSPSA
jgi:TRAP-type mannitol/chloroaromatic compound transport system substrate-binding protein